MRSKAIRYISAFLAAAVIVSAYPMISYADNAAAAADTEAVTASSGLTDYSNYITESGISDKAADSASVSLDSVKADGADISLQDGTLKWNGGTGKISFTVNAPQTALYNLRIVWKPSASGVDVNMGVMLDGKYPFDGSEKAVLTREWKNVSETPRKDAQGNEYAQEQEETGEFLTAVLCDYTGILNEPYEFALTAGTHTLTFVQPEQALEIKSIDFTAPEQTVSYAELSKSYDVKETDAEPIIIQGEAADIKSANNIIPKSNNSDAGMTPSDSKTTKINYIGGTSWQSPGAYIVWKFNVKKSGYYSFNMRYKQSDLVNGESWRWLKIDGETPFTEAKSLKFLYCSSWKYYEFADENDSPYLIKLDEGEHTLTLQVTIGDLSEYFARLKKIVETLGDEYIKIVMITGESPDVNRDYELFKQIPNFSETLSSCYDSLIKLAEDMKKSTGEQSTQAIASMENMARVLNQMVRSPYVAQQYVSDYYSNYTSLSSWLYDMTDMPLSVDEIQLVPAGGKAVNKNAHFFKKLSYGVMRLITSFTSDYTVSSAASDSDKKIRLWVNWGQDQTAVLNSIIEDSFTAKTGIKVQLEIVSASLINGILAGNFPDVSLHMSRTEPVNLGIRGALVDLTQFSDYNEVLGRFQKGAETPYRYGNALYALPDTQSFFLMYYRTDVLERLGLSVPKTWDEFLHASTIIQRNNMNVYIPYTQIASSTATNVGIGSLNLFPTFMLQNGLSIYNKEQNATALDNKAATDVFEYWTDLYTDYGFLKQADFYNRFRVGVMPLGIAPYSTYMTLYSAAPEIKGRWSVATVPGDNDGNRAIAGAGTGCVIVKKSSHKDEAWEFLKWWTSADTQSRYSRNVESILGMIGRTATANIEALSSLAWDSDDLKVILEQWSLVEELPEVPGSYYLTRAVDQAFWAVVNGESTPKDAIAKWSRVADDEIARKIKEYS